MVLPKDLQPLATIHAVVVFIFRQSDLLQAFSVRLQPCSEKPTHFSVMASTTYVHTPTKVGLAKYSNATIHQWAVNGWHYDIIVSARVRAVKNGRTYIE